MRRLFEFLVHWFLLIGPHPLGVLGASDGGASAGDPPSRMVGQARQSSLMGFFNKVHNEKPTEDNKHPKQLHIPDDDLAPRINHDDPKSARVKSQIHSLTPTFGILLSVVTRINFTRLMKPYTKRFRLNNRQN